MSNKNNIWVKKIFFTKNLERITNIYLFFKSIFDFTRVLADNNFKKKFLIIILRDEKSLKNSNFH